MFSINKQQIKNLKNTISSGDRQGTKAKVMEIDKMDKDMECNEREEGNVKERRVLCMCASDKGRDRNSDRNIAPQTRQTETHTDEHTQIETDRQVARREKQEMEREKGKAERRGERSGEQNREGKVNNRK